MVEVLTDNLYLHFSVFMELLDGFRFSNVHFQCYRAFRFSYVHFQCL